MFRMFLPKLSPLCCKHRRLSCIDKNIIMPLRSEGKNRIDVWRHVRKSLRSAEYYMQGRLSALRSDTGENHRGDTGDTMQ